MIKQINEILESIGSRFRTDDGITITMFCGNMTFLNKSFESQQECLEYVQQVAQGIAGR